MKPCPRCKSTRVTHPMATIYGDPLHPGRVIYCRNCWHQLRVSTPEQAGSTKDTRRARNARAVAIWSMCSKVDMEPIPGMSPTPKD